MKLNKLLTVSFFLVTIVLLNQSCNYDKCEESISYVYYKPVYKTEKEIRKVKIEEATPLRNPGKIYSYGDYLFINEINEGIHIFNNSDVTNPVNLSFISIIGNIDLAIKNDILYADNYLDLLSFDISDPENPIQKKSIENIFHTYNGVKSKFLVYYIPTDTVQVLDCSNPNWGYPYYFERGGVYLDSNSKTETSWNPPPAPSGVGGSMARFTISKDRLYTVDRNKIHVFNVSNPDFPTALSNIDVGWGIETIFPYKKNLFIGSNTGMYIYSINNPDYPIFLYKFEHARTCDPVFVIGDYAYVTLRSGNRCSGFTNQLDVLDIKNLKQPKLIKSYPMSNPHGLSVVGDKMVLCEGEFGYKVLDIKDKKHIEIKYTEESGHFYDAIGLSEKDIILVGNDGLYQYKLNDFEMIELSHIPVIKK